MRPIPGYAQPKAEVHQPPPLNLAEARTEGTALVAELLAKQPETAQTNTGSLFIRAEDQTRQIPIRIFVIPTPTNWQTIYEADTDGHGGGHVKLTILYWGGQSNQYFLAQSPAASGANAPPQQPLAAPKRSDGGSTIDPRLPIPFAGSDFWVADLGLEFLHWPEQRLLRKEMHRSRSCNVLESINPRPVPGGYSRVVSWIDIESGGILSAEAYDDHDRLLKQFATKKIEKVRGQWQLEGMEIRNRQTGSRTRIEFNLK